MANREETIDGRNDKWTRTDREMGCRPVYRRRRTPSCRRTTHSSSNHCESSNDITLHDSDSLTSRNKSNRRLRKLIGKLMRENYMLTKQLIEIDADPGIIAKIRETDQLISQLRQEYRKLPKNESQIYDECRRVSNLLEHREKEYQQLQSQYEKMTNALQESSKIQNALSTRNKKLETENSQSVEDISLLKNVIYQLNAELERYQDKLRSHGDKTRSKTGNIDIIPRITDINVGDEIVAKSWGSVNLHALAPLLNAYQESIAEKCELLTEYEHELAVFGGRCKEVVQENDRMHEEVEELTSKCDRYMDEIKVLAKSSILLKKENASLIKEAIDYKSHAEDAQLSYENELHSTIQQNEFLKKECEISTTQLSTLREKYETLSRELESLNNTVGNSVPDVVHTAAVQECKRLLDELKHKYDAERDKLSCQIKQSQEALMRDEKIIITITAERNHLKDLNRTLERNLKRAQRTSEHARCLVRSTQTSCDSFKKQLNKTTAYCEELFSEYERVVAEREKLTKLLHETEKENQSIDRLGKTITNRVDGLRNQLQIVQCGAKQQVATVEKRIKVQESRVHKMKREYRSKVRRLKKLIKQKEDMIRRLQKEKANGGNNLECSRHITAMADREPESVSKSRRATRVTFENLAGTGRDSFRRG